MYDPIAAQKKFYDAAAKELYDTIKTNAPDLTAEWQDLSAAEKDIYLNVFIKETPKDTIY